MNHSTGISDSYYRATEAEFLEDYLKAIDFLTINDHHRLQKEATDISEKAREENGLIKMKLQERDNDISELKAAVKFLTDKINAAIIGEPTSEVLTNEKGVPKAIRFTAMSGTAAT
jgi:hypothetical protein